MKRTLAINESNARARLYLGRALRNMGRLEEAESALSQLIEQEPESEAAREALATVRERMAQSKGATQD